MLSFEELLEIQKNQPKRYVQYLKKNHSETWLDILNYNQKYNFEIDNFARCLYNYIHQLKSYPNCPTCGQPINKFGGNYLKSYHPYCGRKCAASNPDIILQRAKNNKSNNRKFSKTILETHSKVLNSDLNVLSPDDTTNQLKDIYRDIKPVQSIKLILLYQYPQLYKSLFVNDSNFTTLPFENAIWLQVHDFQKPLCKHCKTKSPKFINRVQGYKTYCSEKCRIADAKIDYQNNIAQLLIPNTNADKTATKLFLVDIIAKVDPHSFFGKIVRVNPNMISNIMGLTRYLPEDSKFSERIYHIHNDLSAVQICSKCQTALTYYSFQRGYLSCSNCITGVSSGEIEIRNWIQNLYPDMKIITNSRDIIKPMELDIFIPEKSLAIEYNGVYWHGDGMGTNKIYHKQKYDRCAEKNITLLQFWDYEWIYKQNIVKSLIQSKLGTFATRIYARNCHVKTVPFKEKNEFILNNHLQGCENSNLTYGLYHNDELVSVMCFGKRKITKASSEMEIIRFATKLNNQIIGGASKLLNHFERENNPQKLITYADKRYSNGNLYKTLGFTHSHDSTPNYWYTKANGVFEHRMKFQKHKLSKLFPDNFDPSLSEWQNMQNNGYDRIWDCGNIVFVKNYI